MQRQQNLLRLYYQPERAMLSTPKDGYTGDPTKAVGRKPLQYNNMRRRKKKIPIDQWGWYFKMCKESPPGTR